MCRPYRFGSHADMTETTHRSITSSGIWIPMLAPTCSTMISSDEPRCRGFNQSRRQFPLSTGMILARDSIVGIPIPCSISLPASLFYSIRNTSSRDQLLDHIELIMMMSYRVGPAIPLHHTERQIPVSIRANPTDTFGDTRSAPL